VFAEDEAPDRLQIEIFAQQRADFFFALRQGDRFVG